MDAITTDEALMRAYCDGSYAAFETLYTRHKAAVLRFYIRQAGSLFAEELLQEAFLRLVASRTRYQPTAQFNTFLWTLARSVLIDHYRKQSRQFPRSYGDHAPESIADSERVEPDVALSQGRQAQHLLRLIAELPAAQREVFLLREEGGLTLAEIAEVVGIGLEAAKSRLRYAITKLRAGLETFQ